FHVTGVQTCALPILLTQIEHGGVIDDCILEQFGEPEIQWMDEEDLLRLDLGHPEDSDVSDFECIVDETDMVVLDLEIGDNFKFRSEERRVGKECRCR